jgi:rubrerythrin
MMARRRDNATKEEDTMSHDKLQDAARERMAWTGERYTVARRAVFRQYKEAQGGEYDSAAARSKAFEVVAAQLATHGQEVRGRLTSASGIEEIQRRFALRAFRDLGHSVDDQPSETTDKGRPHWRCRRCGSDLQLNGLGRWMSSSGTGRCVHEGASW